MSTVNPNSDGLATRRLEAVAGFAEWRLCGLNYFAAVNRAAHGTIEVFLSNAAAKRDLSINLTVAGWRAVFDVVNRVTPLDSPAPGANGRLTAAELHYAAGVIERLSADFGSRHPEHYEWCADSIRHEAENCYPGGSKYIDDEVTA